MGEMTVSEAWTLFLGFASAFVLLANAYDKFKAAKKHANAPNAVQDQRIKALEEWKCEQEEWRKSVERKLDNDRNEFNMIHDGNQACFQALLALLDHGIDGNNIDQMQNAKVVLQKHLISKT